jgi:hypothetical protein
MFLGRERLRYCHSPMRFHETSEAIRCLENSVVLVGGSMFERSARTGRIEKQGTCRWEAEAVDLSANFRRACANLRSSIHLVRLREALAHDGPASVMASVAA